MNDALLAWVLDVFCVEFPFVSVVKVCHGSRFVGFKYCDCFCVRVMSYGDVFEVRSFDMVVEVVMVLSDRGNEVFAAFRDGVLAFCDPLFFDGLHAILVSHLGLRCL